ncbi:MAG TPA: group II intron reverse transcriptase/maturase [Acidimicrobiales bacterium]|nr:group II intron reverse transcriptase/maturase [Acidimicrobiales bacterium]
MNTDAPWPDLDEAEWRVLKIQAKLHQWAADDPTRRFDDLFNLVADPAFLVVAWDRVRGNRGARSAGVDGVTPRSIVFGREKFLTELRDDLKARRFVPLPAREKLIPKKSGKLRGLGIPTARDRTVQAALKLVLEPIFEAEFQPCSYGFRPKRRAQDAIEEIFFYTTHSYEWVLEGDIKSCFDEIDHTALMGRVRDRIGDKRVLRLVKAFLKAGILGEDQVMRDTVTGTPQGGILSPLLANIALSVLDEHFMGAWESWGGTYKRRRRRLAGLANYRLVRYADDFVVLVAGDRHHVEELREQVAAVLAPMGLRLSEEKTVITHIDEGFDFLGFHIQRKRKEGTQRRTLYTYPSKAALAAVKAKVRVLTQGNTDQTLANLLQRVNPVLRGWANYFRHGVSARTFSYLNAFSWRRVVNWLRHKHPRASWKWLRRFYLPGWRPTDGGVSLLNPATIPITRYRYRGARIPSPWAHLIEEGASPAA